jgi:hypothetical protein
MSKHNQIKTVISGSYRKHFNEMIALKRLLETSGVSVQAPVSDGVINAGEEFILLDEDPLHDPRTLQDSILAKIRSSSFLVLANVGGYIGKAAVFEMGYAVSLGLQILTLEPVEDPNLAGYCRNLNEVFPHFNSRESDSCQRAI